MNHNYRYIYESEISNNIMKVFLLALLLVLASAKTVAFLDTADLITDADCLKRTYDRINVRAYQSIGKVDPYVIKSLDAVKKAGMTADVYMVPCFFCANPAAQAEQLAEALKGSSFETVWVQVEGAWSLDQAGNKLFLESLVNGLKSKGLHVGIFTFQPTWDRLLGKSYDGMSTLPLWYMRWNEDPYDGDFVSFGGWKKPRAKQYDTDDRVCAISVNDDSYYTDN